MKKFKSSYSKCMLMATCLLLIVLLFAICIVANQLIRLPIDSLGFIGASAVLCFILITLLYAFFSQIEYVYLTEESVIIKKKFGEIIIHRFDIVQVQYKKSLMSDVRLWGISGLFGHIGLFWNSKIGKYSAFVKDGNSMLEIKTKEKCYVISCDDYTQLINLLQN